MFENLFEPTHLIVILAIALIVFGPRRLPELGRSLGEAIRGFKSTVSAPDPKPAPPTLLEARRDTGREETAAAPSGTRSSS